MKKFEIGKTYSMKSICDHNCIWTYKVIGRTNKTIKIEDEKGNKQTCRISKISEYNNEETIYPLGQYSMAPSLRAI